MCVSVKWASFFAGNARTPTTHLPGALESVKILAHTYSTHDLGHRPAIPSCASCASAFQLQLGSFFFLVQTGVLACILRHGKPPRNVSHTAIAQRHTSTPLPPGVCVLERGLMGAGRTNSRPKIDLQKFCSSLRRELGRKEGRRGGGRDVLVFANHLSVRSSISPPFSYPHHHHCNVISQTQTFLREIIRCKCPRVIACAGAWSHRAHGVTQFPRGKIEGFWGEMHAALGGRVCVHAYIR